VFDYHDVASPKASDPGPFVDDAVAESGLATSAVRPRAFSAAPLGDLGYVLPLCPSPRLCQFITTPVRLRAPVHMSDLAADAAFPVLVTIATLPSIAPSYSPERV